MAKEVKEVAVTGDKTPSSREAELIRAITKPNITIEVIVPDNIDPKEWMTQTSIVCHELDRTERKGSVLFVALGRLLAVAKENDCAILRENGFETFEAFLVNKAIPEFGVSRATCFEAIAIVERWKNLTVAEFSSIGRRNIRLLSKVIEEGHEDRAEAKKLIKKAVEMPSPDFKAYIESAYHLEPGSSTGEVIRIPTSKAVANAWQKFHEDARVQAYVGKSKPDLILKRMIMECSAEWLAKGVEVMEKDREAPLELPPPEVVDAEAGAVVDAEPGVEDQVQALA